MNKVIEATGKTIEEAISNGKKLLGIDDSVEVETEVLERPKAGFLGIGGTAAKVKITYVEEETDKVGSFLNGLFEKMQIEVAVSEADIGKILKGQTVEYTLDGYADSVFHGQVSEVRIAPTTVSNVVTYTVIVDVDNKDQKMIPGMTANVSIITNKSENVICIPTEALKFTPTEITGGKKYKEQGIWILKDNKPQRISIQLGAKDSEKTEIISAELQENDKVIIKSKSSSKKKTQTGRPMRMF